MQRSLTMPETLADQEYEQKFVYELFESHCRLSKRKQIETDSVYYSSPEEQQMVCFELFALFFKLCRVHLSGRQKPNQMLQFLT